MIENIQITGRHTKLNKDIEYYVGKKIGQLDRYVPKKARPSLQVEVKLKEAKTRDKSNFACEVIMHLPKGEVTVEEKAVTMLAAIDLAENKLKIQLKKYKEKHGGPRLHRRVLGRLKQR